MKIRYHATLALHMHVLRHATPLVTDLAESSVAHAFCRLIRFVRFLEWPHTIGVGHFINLPTPGTQLPFKSADSGELCIITEPLSSVSETSIFPR